MENKASGRSFNPLRGVFWAVAIVAAFAAGLWAFHDQVPGSVVPDSRDHMAADPSLDSAGNAVASAARQPATEAPPAAEVTPAPATPTDGTAADATTEPAEPQQQADAATAGDAEANASADQTAAADTPDPEQLKTGLFPPDAVKDAKATLCYFSFNTPTEFYRARIMAQAMNKYSPIQITVKELIPNNADIEDAFKAMLKTGQRCDGVVLSGHHTDEYYGERTSGSIDIEDFEQMSYNPKYSGWFANVKALWLEGCNTGKFRIFAKKDNIDDDERIDGSPLKRMTALMDLGDISGSIDDMTELLNDNLNEDNLVSGYLRIFPNATTFSWTDKAPGIKAGSDHSLPFHIAQLSHILNPDPSIYVNPMPVHLPKEAALHYSAALYGMLSRGSKTDTLVPGMTEENFIKAWSRHGNFRYKWAFDNPSLRGFGNLMDEGNEVERQLRGLRAVQVAIDQDWIEDDDSVMQVANWILKHKSVTPFGTYTLQAMLTKARANDHKLYGELLTAMRKNTTLQHSLQQASQAGGYRAHDARQMLATIAPPERQGKARAEAKAASTTVADRTH